MKKHLLLLFLAVSTFSVFSQKKAKKNTEKKDSIIEVINVVTSYTPTIADAFKIKKNPSIILSNNSKKKKLTYSIFSAPVASTFVPKSGVVKGIDVGKKERLFDNYLALGYGNFRSPFIEAFLRQNRRFENDYGLYIKYISSEGGITNSPLNNGYSTLKTGAYYTDEGRYFTWKIGGNVQQQKYNWYGLPAIGFDTESINAIFEKQTYGFYELTGELIFEDSYFTTIKTSLSLFDDSFGSYENSFSLQPNFKLPLYKISRHLDELEFHTSIDYLQGKFKQSYGNNEEVPYRFFNLSIHPIYKIDWNKFNIKIGTKIFLTSDIENNLTDILPYPDVLISYPIISNSTTIYAGASGDLHMNSYRNMTNENPFVSPTLFLTQTNQQYNLFGGVNGKLSPDVSFNLNASYKNDEDLPLFVRNNSKSNGVFDSTSTLLGYEYGNSFNVFYDDISTLSIFAEVEIDLTKRLVIGGNIQSHSYTTTFQQKAWNLPTIEGAIYGRYKNDKWYATTNIFFVGERQDVLYNESFPSTISGIQSLDAFIDLNINAGYYFNDFFSGFIKLKNILGTEYERFANFNVQGFQIMGGITYQFDF